MKKDRLFTFGCSHTLYHWPTWADMIGLDYKNHYNFGHPGLGNFAIYNKVIRAIDHFNVTKEDTILICLSSWDRVDYFNETGYWEGIGGLTGNEANRLFGETFVKNHITNSAYEIEKVFTYVKSIQLILDSIGCKYKIKNAFACHHKDITDTALKKIESICDGFDSLYIKNKDMSDKSYMTYDLNGNLRMDGHLTIKEHLRFVKESFTEFYNEKNDDKILEWETHISKSSLDINMYFKPRYWTFESNALQHYRLRENSELPSEKIRNIL